LKLIVQLPNIVTRSGVRLHAR